MRADAIESAATDTGSRRGVSARRVCAR